MKENKYKGIVHDITSSIYHSIKRTEEGLLYCSKSSLYRFWKDQQDFKQGKPLEISTPMKLGSFLDACLLDPTEKANFYGKEENPHLTKRKDGVLVCSSAEAKAWKKNAEESGKMEISQAEQYEVKQNILHIQYDPRAQSLLTNMQPQCAIFSDYDGIPTKSLLDIVPDKNGEFGNALADLKRTREFSPNKFKYHLLNMGYHWQAAKYLDDWNREQRLMAASDPTHVADIREDWYFLLANSQSPYGCGVARLHPNIIQRGRDEYQSAMELWREAMATNTFKNPYALCSTIHTFE